MCWHIALLFRNNGIDQCGCLMLPTDTLCYLPLDFFPSKLISPPDIFGSIYVSVVSIDLDNMGFSANAHAIVRDQF